VFGFWQVYAAALVVVVFVVLPKLFFALLADRFRFGDYALSPKVFWILLSFHFHFGFRELIDRVFADKMAGGLPARIFMALCELLGNCFFVLTLSPIILGLSNHAAWSLPWMLLFHDPLLLLKIGGLIVLASLLLGSIPIVKTFEPLHTLVYGGIVLMFVATSVALLRFRRTLD